MAAKQTVLEVDSRKRITLGVLAAHDRYLVEVEDDGTIILRPAVVMPVAQARLLASEAGSAVDAFLDDPASGTRRSRPGR